MMRKLLVFFLLSGVLGVMTGFPAHAGENEIFFATEEWQNATHRDGTGLYWDILRAVFESEGYAVVPKIRSYEGAVKLVEKKEADAMIGAYAGEVENGVYPSHFFGVDVVQAIGRKTADYRLTGMESLRGKNLAWIKGYSYHNYLPDDIVRSVTIRRVDSRDTGFRLMAGGRVDLFLDAGSDLAEFLKANSGQYPEADFDRATIKELHLYVVFSQTDRGRQLAGLFDKKFSALLENGTIRTLYAKYRDANFVYPSTFP